MGLGGVLAAFDKRYRRTRKVTVKKIMPKDDVLDTTEAQPNTGVTV